MEHETAFCRAIQQHGIALIRSVTRDLVKISFDPSVDPQEQMRDFPLGPDESWFLTIHDPHQVYVCIKGPIMEAKQAAWLLKHKVVWAYVDAPKNGGGRLPLPGSL
jgi:hypothetical protein